MTEAGGGIKPRVPKYKTEGDYAAPSPEVLNGGAPLKIRSIEESPKSAPGSSDTLVAAVGKIFQAVTAQIAYHEREAQKLRESLKPFAGLAPRHNVPPDGSVSEAAIRAVLDMAEKLVPTGENQS